jgi:hypothetical protein
MLLPQAFDFHCHLSSTASLESVGYWTVLRKQPLISPSVPDQFTAAPPFVLDEAQTF